MRFRDIFETKATNNQTLYTRIVQLNGGRSAQYSKANYETIAREGYARNYIINRCLAEIINAAVQIEWKVMAYDNKGNVEEIKNHPAIKVIEKPNPVMTQAELIKRAIVYYSIGGDAPFTRITVDGGNRIKQLYVHNPKKISFDLTGDVDNPYNNIRYNGQIQDEIEPQNFMLWKNFDPNDLFDGLGRGLSPLEPITKSGDLLDGFMTWNLSLLLNGGSLSGIIATDEYMPDPNYERAKAQIKNDHQGKDNVGKFLLLEGGAKYYSSGVSPREMEWLDGKESVAADICIGMGVDPLIIGMNDKSSYNNKNEAYKALYTNKVIPLIRSLADELTPFLMLADNEYIDLDYSKIPCLQEDQNELSDRLQKMKWLTINEKRQAIGKEPLKKNGDIIVADNIIIDEEGNLYMPSNYVSVEDMQAPPQQEGPEPQQVGGKMLY